MRVFLGSYVCSDESHLCRRILIESSGESIDIEVVAAGADRHVGLVVGLTVQPPHLCQKLPAPGDGVGRRGVGLPGPGRTYWRFQWHGHGRLRAGRETDGLSALGTKKKTLGVMTCNLEFASSSGSPFSRSTVDPTRGSQR